MYVMYVRYVFCGFLAHYSFSRKNASTISMCTQTPIQNRRDINRFQQRQHTRAFAVI